MHDHIFIGWDVGTSWTKCAILDSADGLLAHEEEPTPRPNIEGDRVGWQLQEFIDVLVRLTARCLTKLDLRETKAVHLSITSMWLTFSRFVAPFGAGPLESSAAGIDIWSYNDNRSAQFNATAHQLGIDLRYGFEWPPRLLYSIGQQGALAEDERVSSLHSLLAWYVTGRLALDRHTLQVSGLWDSNSDTSYNEQVLRALNVADANLPAATPAASLVGIARKEFCGQVGLSMPVLLYQGVGDTFGSILACDGINVGDFVFVGGTQGILMRVRRPVSDWLAGGGVERDEEFFDWLTFVIRPPAVERDNATNVESVVVRGAEDSASGVFLSGVEAEASSQSIAESLEVAMTEVLNKESERNSREPGSSGFSLRLVITGGARKTRSFESALQHLTTITNAQVYVSGHATDAIGAARIARVGYMACAMPQKQMEA